MTAPAGQQLHALHDRLGIEPGVLLSAGSQPRGGDFRGFTITAEQAWRRPWNGDSNHWLGVTALRPGTKGRGTASDLAGLHALVCDLDVKAGGMPDWGAAGAVVRDVADMLNAGPAGVVTTGHGLQPYWAVEGPEDPRWPDLHARFNRLVKVAAKAHKGDADTTKDAARIWRVPGSVNVKLPGESLPVGLSLPESWRPVTADEVADVLDAYLSDDDGHDDDQAAQPDRSTWLWADTDCRYTAAMVAGWATDTPTGGCHPWLVKNAVKLAAAHRRGCLTADGHRRAVEALTRRFTELVTHRAVGRREVPMALQWGEDKARWKTDAGCRKELKGHLHDGEATDWIADPGGADGDGLWERRPLFAWCRDMGRARLLSPDAILGYVLARVRVELGHQVFVPPMVGHIQPLNLGIIHCGRSGGGKSAVREAVDDLPVWSGHPLAVLGSGEGLVDTYAATEPDGEGGTRLRWHTRTALFVADEVDMLEALRARRGGTLMSTLRTAVSGGRIGFGYRGNRTQLPARSYSLAVVVAAQPTRMQWLLDEADAGTPQRFLWCQSDYPDMPEPGEHHREPDPPPIHLPPDRRHGEKVFKFTDDMVMQVRRARWENRAGAAGPMASHLMLTRCKVACLLAAAEGRWTVSEADWADAGLITARSQTMIDHTQRVLAAEAEQLVRRQGTADGHRQVAAAEVTDTAAETRVAQRIARHVHSHRTDHGCTRSCIRDQTAARDRRHIAPAIARAAEADWITVRSDPHPTKKTARATYYRPGRHKP